MWQVFYGMVNHDGDTKDTYFFHKPLAKSRGNPFPGVNSTVHPNDLLGVVGWLANLKGTPCSITSHLSWSSSVQSYQTFYSARGHFLSLLCGFKHEVRMLAKTPTHMSLPLLLVILAVVHRTTCQLPTCPTWSRVGRPEIQLSPWLCYYLAVWPCTSDFTSLGLCSLNHKMKNQTEGCLWLVHV